MVYTANPFYRHTSWCCSVFIHEKSDENGRFLDFTRHFTLNHLYGGYVCSGNCVEPSIWLTTSNIEMVYTANPFCRHTSWCCSVFIHEKVTKMDIFFILKDIYQDGLHSQSILQAYIMMFQYVYSRKGTKTDNFFISQDIYPKTTCMVAMYAPGIV